MRVESPPISDPAKADIAGRIEMSIFALLHRTILGARVAEGLPASYRLAIGGPVEESAKSQKPIFAVAPLILIAMATILMLQLRSFNLLFLVAWVAPLAFIGVVIVAAQRLDPIPHISRELGASGL